LDKIYLVNFLDFGGFWEKFLSEVGRWGVQVAQIDILGGVKLGLNWLLIGLNWLLLALFLRGWAAEFLRNWLL